MTKPREATRPDRFQAGELHVHQCPLCLGLEDCRDVCRKHPSRGLAAAKFGQRRFCAGCRADST